MSTRSSLRKSGVGVLLVISIMGAGMSFSQPESGRSLRRSDALHSSGKSEFVFAGGVRLQYVDWGGPGETLIFIPGGCDTAFVFGDTASRLARHFRVLGLTARGCGASARPAEGYDMTHQIDDIVGFMDALGIRHCTLIAHSMGGGKITQFAHWHPERVDHLIYLDTIYGYVAPGLEEGINAGVKKILRGDAMDSRKNWRARAKIWEPGAQSAAMDRDFEENYLIEPDGKIKKRYETPAAWRKEVDPDVQAGLYTDTHIEKPALMIFAMDTDQDRVMQLPEENRGGLEPLIRQTDEHRREEIERFRRNGDHVRIVELRHTAHYCFVQRPATVSRLIAAFLTSSVA